MNAAWKLKKLAASAIKKVSLDMQNAFNLMPCTRIMDALENAKVPVYFHSIIGDYFWDRVMLTHTASGMIR